MGDGHHGDGCATRPAGASSVVVGSFFYCIFHVFCAPPLSTETISVAHTDVAGETEVVEGAAMTTLSAPHERPLPQHRIGTFAHLLVLCVMESLVAMARYMCYKCPT